VLPLLATTAANVPKLTLFDYLPVLDRVRIIAYRYNNLTGRQPNIVYFPPDEYVELQAYLQFHSEEGFFMARPPAVIESELFGMLIRIAMYANGIRVEFKES